MSVDFLIALAILFGLSAIGALSLNIGGDGLPKHLEAVKVSHVRQARRL